jgi:hypothetical protein
MSGSAKDMIFQFTYGKQRLSALAVKIGRVMTGIQLARAWTDPLAGSCKRGDETSGSINCEKIRDSQRTG